MRILRIVNAMGYIDDDLISEAADITGVKTKRGWFKWGAMAACLCLMIAGGAGIHLHLKNYVERYNIYVYAEEKYMDNVSAAEVTAEQAEYLAAANGIHNTISALGYEWYSNCYYDFEKNEIMVGLTDVSEENRDTALTYIDGTEVQFYQCEYSYQYLEEIYDRLEEKNLILKAVGVERYNISVACNRVIVYISDKNNYAALFAVNELADAGSAVVFKTESEFPTTDNRS